MTSTLYIVCARIYVCMLLTFNLMTLFFICPIHMLFPFGVLSELLQ